MYNRNKKQLIIVSINSKIMVKKSKKLSFFRVVSIKSNRDFKGQIFSLGKTFKMSTSVSLNVRDNMPSALNVILIIPYS